MRIAFYLSLLLLLAACGGAATQTATDYRRINGPTMGTTYNITYRHPEQADYTAEVDSLLATINDAVSTYIPTSLISRYNTDVALTLDDLDGELEQIFLSNLNASVLMYRLTDGAFDPQVMPLVNYWGFGYEPKRAVTQVDSLKVAELMSYRTDDLSVTLQELPGTPSGIIRKPHPQQQLDFSAIAKGAAVDAIGQLLTAGGVTDYFVEVGGEVRTLGRNPRGTAWVMAVSTPDPDAAITDAEVLLKVSGKAVATSGNYRNYYEVEGQKYGHTINPKTGFPELNNLLGATIIADNCATADALATACMVLGHPDAVQLIDGIESVEGLFIYGAADGSLQIDRTRGMQPYILE